MAAHRSGIFWFHLLRKTCRPRFLPPANEVCEGYVMLGYVFTGVCLSTGGCLPHCMLGYTPPWAGTHPLGRHPPGQTPPTPCPDTPLGRHPPAQCMLGYTHTHPAQGMLGYGQQAGSTHLTGMYSCLEGRL